MLGMQDQTDVKHSGDIGGWDFFREHVQKVFGVGQVVSWLDLFIAMAQPGKRRDDGREFGDEADGCPIPGGVIPDIRYRIKHS